MAPIPPMDDLAIHLATFESLMGPLEEFGAPLDAAMWDLSNRRSITDSELMRRWGHTRKSTTNQLFIKLCKVFRFHKLLV